MQSIDPRLWRPLFDAVYEMNTARDHHDFLTAVTAGMSRLIPAEVSHVHVIDRATGRMVHHAYPADPFTAEEKAYYAAHPNENALVDYFQRTGDQHARRTSDVVDLASYRRTEFFQRCLSRLGFLHTLALPIAVDEHTVGAFVLDRSTRDFTRRHCELLDAFAPHFRLAWQKHSDPWTMRRPPVPTARERLRQLGLTPREAEICARIGPFLKERGLMFVGIDVIGDWLTEINVTSPTGIRAIRRLGGPDVAAKIWDVIEARAAQR